MLILSAVWLVLLVVEFTRGLSPILQTANDVIWIAFVLQFLIEVIVAPSRTLYLRKNWITAISLGAPGPAPVAARTVRPSCSSRPGRPWIPPRAVAGSVRITSADSVRFTRVRAEAFIDRVY
jgi:hypothetical protein